MEFSTQEISLLREIQRDSGLSLATLAERCGMAQSTVWRKLQDFEAAGVIQARVTLLDPAQLDCKLLVLAAITLEDHAEATVAGFVQLIETRPEIVECLKTSGASDFRLKVRARDVDAYEAFMTRYLLRSPHVKSVHSSFVLKELKSTTELPVG